MKKLLIVCMLFAGAVTQASAQDLKPEDYGYFNHLCGGITLGTDGIGFEVAAPLTYNFSVRMGYSFMPKFKYSKGLDLTNSDGTLPGAFKERSAELQGKLNMGDFKLLFDWYPFRSSSFHATAGFYIGRSSFIELNNTNDFMNEEYNGKAGIQLGDGSKPETSYSVFTDQNGDVKAELKVNSFKPYIGIGFGRAVPKGRVGVQCDLGVQFWGKPELCAYMNYKDRVTGDWDTRYEPVKKNRIVNPKSDYQDLKDAIKTIEKIRVYPVINIRINGRIF